jgi:hypothetical protein
LAHSLLLLTAPGKLPLKTEYCRLPLQAPNFLLLAQKLVIRHSSLVTSFMFLRPLILLLALAGLCPDAGAATYYVSPTGSDTNDGTTELTPWQSAAKVSSLTNLLQPGDSVLFERGGVWRQQLKVPRSGTNGNPIVFGAYGSGAKPRFMGSDVLDNALFEPVEGTNAVTVYRYPWPFTNRVNWVFRDGVYLQSGFVLAGFSLNFGAQSNLVKTFPNLWAATSNYIFVSTAGTDPRTNGVTYSAAVREDMVFANYVNHITFQNLAADETAYWDGGYGMRAEWTQDIRFENVDIYRAGKHHIGAINCSNFVADGVLCELSMPDMFYGAASATVSYSDYRRVNDSGYWKNVIVTNVVGSSCQAFYSHGEGLQEVVLENYIVRRTDLVLAKQFPTQSIRLKGGEMKDLAIIRVYASDAVIDSVRFTGEQSQVVVADGVKRAVVKNCVFDGANFYSAYISHYGSGLIVQNSAFFADSARNTNNFPAPATIFNFVAKPITFTGNLVAGIRSPFYFTKDRAPEIVSDRNYFATTNAAGNPPIFQVNDQYFTLSLPEWRVRGWDRSSATGEQIAGFSNATAFVAWLATNGVSALPSPIREEWAVGGTPAFGP